MQVKDQQVPDHRALVARPQKLSENQPYCTSSRDPSRAAHPSSFRLSARSKNLVPRSPAVHDVRVLPPTRHRNRMTLTMFEKSSVQNGVSVEVGGLCHRGSDASDPRSASLRAKMTQSDGLLPASASECETGCSCSTATSPCAMASRCTIGPSDRCRFEI